MSERGRKESNFSPFNTKFRTNYVNFAHLTSFGRDFLKPRFFWGGAGKMTLNESDSVPAYY